MIVVTTTRSQSATQEVFQVLVRGITYKYDSDNGENEHGLQVLAEQRQIQYQGRLLTYIALFCCRQSTFTRRSSFPRVSSFLLKIHQRIQLRAFVS